MKSLILSLLFLPFLCAAQNKHLVTCTNIADLKTKPVEANVVYLVVGKTTIGDSGGGLYYFDASATDAEDMTYSNVIVSNTTPTGRFKRVNTRNISLTQGMLSIEGGRKTFITSTTTNASGEATVNLTYENTAGGTPIFSSSPVMVLCSGNQNVTDPNDVVLGGLKVVSADFKTVTCKFVRGNSSVISLIGLTVLGYRAAPSGANVSIMVIGM